MEADPQRIGEPAAAPEPDAGTPLGRRVLLGMLWGGAMGVVWGGRVQSGLARLVRPLVGVDPRGLAQLIPGAKGFRIYSVTGGMPGVQTEAYRLTVSGLVDRPTTLSLADLQALPVTELTRDFQCVTGWRVPAVAWAGVRLADLLDHVGAQPAARAVTFRSFDGAYTESLTLDQARRDDLIVAYSMLGKPVTRAHGGPVRLYVAPMYGYKSCKWLGGIEIVDRVASGYWERRGYDDDAWIGRSNGRTDRPVP